MTVVSPRPRAVALESAFVGRIYRTREAAFGTASYETILRSVGPLGPLTRDQAQQAIIIAGFGLGAITRDVSGALVRTF